MVCGIDVVDMFAFPGGTDKSSGRLATPASYVSYDGNRR